MDSKKQNHWWALEIEPLIRFSLFFLKQSDEAAVAAAFLSVDAPKEIVQKILETQLEAFNSLKDSIEAWWATVEIKKDS
jgi:hypothetical protein